MKIDLDWLSPWFTLAVLISGTVLMTTIALAESDVLGYTEHGVAVTKEDVKVKNINVRQVRGFEWNSKQDVLILRLNGNKKVIVEFYGKCWDIDFATQIRFNTFGNFTFFSAGDTITPIAFGRASAFPCRIKNLYEQVPA